MIVHIGNETEVEEEAFLGTVYSAADRKEVSHVLLPNYTPSSLRGKCLLERDLGWKFPCSSLYHL
jgi:hypothetical protein